MKSILILTLFFICNITQAASSEYCVRAGAYSSDCYYGYNAAAHGGGRNAGFEACSNYTEPSAKDWCEAGAAFYDAPERGSGYTVVQPSPRPWDEPNYSFSIKKRGH